MIGSGHERVNIKNRKPNDKSYTIQSTYYVTMRHGHATIVVVGNQ